MSESLNHAFLKAYDKDKVREAKRKLVATERASQMAAEQVAELMMRFDTSSVPIPSPRMLDKRGDAMRLPAGDENPSQQSVTSAIAPPSPRKPSLAGQRLDAPQPPSTRASQHSVDDRRPTEAPLTDDQATDMQASESASQQAEQMALRQKIALQMLQAGNWPEQPIDAFIGALPVVAQQKSAETDAPVRQPVRAEESVEEIHQQASELATEKSPAVSSANMPSSRRDPQHTSLPSVNQPSSASGAGPGSAAPQGAGQPLSQSPKQQPSDSVSGKAPAVAGFPNTQEPSAGASPHPPAMDALGKQPGQPLQPLVAPRGPALSSPDQREPAQAQAETKARGQVSQQADEQAPQHAAEGDIFRLDRPSYMGPTQLEQAGPAPFGDAPAAIPDADDDSSMLGEISDSVTSADINPTLDFNTAKSDSSSRQADRVSTETRGRQQVERELRQARARVFNPVWEVDNFQWPAVCLELMEQLNEKLERVAKNLAAACQEGLQVLAITSPQRGEGSSTVACCLALLAGHHGLKVAIVDGDLEQPSLSYQTNLDVEQDWRAAILHHLPLEEVAIHSIEDQVTLVPLLSPVSSNELASDDNRIALMLQELADSFDLVIVDMGAMASARNLVSSMGQQGVISAAVAVVDYRNSAPQLIESCLLRLRQAGIASIGLVENFAA